MIARRTRQVGPAARRKITAAAPREDIAFECPTDALAALRRRTDRVLRITPNRDGFQMRYRGHDLGGVHLSRTWERGARFDIDGATIPAAFFPLQGSTHLIDDAQTYVRNAGNGGSFTVARRASFEPQPGYSELLVVLAPDLLQRCLDALEVTAPAQELLRRAALDTRLPGLSRLRALALDALNMADDPAEARFMALSAPLMAESIALQAARVLAATLDEPSRDTAGGDSALGRAVVFIKDRLCDPLAMEDIAWEAGVSIRRLQVLFQGALGCTPRDYILQQRLDRARDLLRRHLVATVTDAAMASGISHLGRFSASYASRFGETPSQTLRGSR